MVDGSDKEADGRERRQYPRYAAALQVDYASGENFLFSYIQNISEMGIFIRSDDPLAIGTELKLRFPLEGGTPFELEGTVVWVNNTNPNADNPNPGMGVQFRGLTPEQRHRLVELIRTVAYLKE